MRILRLSTLIIILCALPPAQVGYAGESENEWFKTPHKVVASSTEFVDLGRQYLLGFSLFNTVDHADFYFSGVDFRIGLLDRFDGDLKLRWRFTLLDLGVANGDFPTSWRNWPDRHTQQGRRRNVARFDGGVTLFDFDHSLALESYTRYLSLRAGFSTQPDREAQVLFLPAMRAVLGVGSLCFGSGPLAAFEEKAGDCLLGLEGRMRARLQLMLWQHLVVDVKGEAGHFQGASGASTLAASVGLFYLSEAFPRYVQSAIWEIGLLGERTLWFMDSLERPLSRFSLQLRLHLEND